MIPRKRLLASAIVTACCSLSLVQGSAAIAPVQQQQQQQQQQPSPSSHRLRPQRQPRRTMDNHDQQERQRRHRHNDYQYNYYTQQQEKNSNGKHWKTEQSEASLADVWLCYAFALGWSMWFLSSFLNTDLMRFAESESVLVHGNVREVSIEDDSLGTGIPTYHALIDYIITVRREAEQARIQVRKSFQTQHLLQQGFANVELLVLPEEPTSSVLREDWQREVATQNALEEDIISIGHSEGASTGVGGDYFMTRVDILAKRFSLILSGTLVTASLIGAVQQVHRLETERLQFFGWISVCVGSVLLWPLAMFSLRIVALCQRLGQIPTEKSGIILRCDTNAQAGATLNTDEVKKYTQHEDKDLFGKHNNGNFTTRHLNNVSHADTFEKLKSHHRKHHHAPISISEEESESLDEIEQRRISGGDTDAAAAMGAGVVDHDEYRHRRQMSVNTNTDESACYFVKLPSDNKRSEAVNNSGSRLDDSSLSTISADSRMSRHQRNSVASS